MASDAYFINGLCRAWAAFIQYYAGDSPTGSLGAATDDGAQEAARKAGHSSISWYASTFLLLAIPFLYMRAPDLVGLMTTLDKQGVHLVKGVTAPILLVAYLVLMRGNHVGAILALPIFFAALLEDMGFYAMAPLFIIGVTLLMGERRLQWIALTIALIMGALLLTFVSACSTAMIHFPLRVYSTCQRWMPPSGFREAGNRAL